MHRRRSCSAEPDPVTRRLLTLLGALVLLGVLVTACSDDADVLSGPGAGTSSGEGATSAEFDGRTFVSTDITGHELVDGTFVTLRFEGPTFSRNAGCNTTGSGYSVNGGHLRVVGEGFSTLIGCEQDLEEQDRWLQDFLAAGPAYELEGDELELTGGGVTIELSSQGDDDLPLVGTRWTLESVAVGGAVSSVPAGVSDPTIFIGEDGMAELTTGCNSGGAGVGTSISEDGRDTLNFGALRTTKMACDEAAMDLETTVLAVLDSGPAFLIDGDSLELTGPDGTTLIYRAG